MPTGSVPSQLATFVFNHANNTFDRKKISKTLNTIWNGQGLPITGRRIPPWRCFDRGMRFHTGSRLLVYTVPWSVKTWIIFKFPFGGSIQTRMVAYGTASLQRIVGLRTHTA